MTRYIFNATVVNVSEKKAVARGRKENDKTILDEESMGWYVHFDFGCSIRLGTTHPPDFVKGDRVRITMERIK